MIRKQKKIAKQVFNFTAIFEPAEEGGYVVFVPALPGCVTQGETLEEAMIMAKDAIEGYLASMKDLGEKLPLGQEAGMVISRIPATVCSDFSSFQLLLPAFGNTN